MPSLNKKSSMNLSRRKFLGLLGGTALGAVIFEACGFPEQEYLVQSPVDMPEDYVKGEDNWYATTSETSDYGESIIVRVMQGRAKKIEGNPDFPNTLGKHRAVTETELQTFYHPDRIPGPLFRKTRSGNHRPISWKEAVSIMSENINKNGNKTIITKPLRGLNRSVVSRFTNKMDASHLTISALRDNSLYESSKQVFGTDSMPYFDIKNADIIISFGLDFLGTWGPVEYQHQYGAFRSKEHRGFLVQIEPRMSLTAANADKWVCTAPGTEGLLALLIAKTLIESKTTDKRDVEKFFHLSGISSINDLNNTNVNLDPQSVSIATGVSEDNINKILEKIELGRKMLFLSGGTSSGYKNANSLNSLVMGMNYLSGSVNSAGGIILNPGNLFDTINIGDDKVKFHSTSSWNSQDDWNKELSRWQTGSQNLVLIKGVDLINELPNRDEIVESMSLINLTVGFGSIMNDTLERCDLVLPDTTTLHSWGSDVPEPRTGYQSVAFQQPVASDPLTRDGLRKISDARNFYNIIAQITEDTPASFSYSDLCKQFSDLIFEKSKNVPTSIKASNKDDFFKGILARGGWWSIDKNKTKPQKANIKVDNPITEIDIKNNEFYLIPFKSHVFGDGNSLANPWAQATPDPLTSVTWDSWIEMNPKKAEKLKIKSGDIVTISSNVGEIDVTVYIHPAVPTNVVAIPIGQGKMFSGRYAENIGSNVMELIDGNNLNENGDLCWCETTVKIKKTGKRKKISKFEGTVPAVSVEPGVPILTLAPDESAEDGFNRAHKEHLEHTFGNK